MESNLEVTEKRQFKVCPRHPDGPRYKVAPFRCVQCRRHHRRTDYDKRGTSSVDKLCTIEGRARRKGIEFDLTKDSLAELISQPCAYAIRPETDIKVGVDRKDSTKGYTLDNCLPCCALHNLLKSNILTHDNMLDAVNRYQIACGNSQGGRKKGPRTTFEPYNRHSVVTMSTIDWSSVPSRNDHIAGKAKRKRYVPVPSGLDLAGRQEYMRQRHQPARRVAALRT